MISCIAVMYRGYRNGLLSASDYTNITQCEVLDDLKLGLGYELFDKKGYNKSYNFLYQSKEEKTRLCREIIKSIDNLKENDITKIKFLDHLYGGKIKTLNKKESFLNKLFKRKNK